MRGSHQTSELGLLVSLVQGAEDGAARQIQQIVQLSEAETHTHTETKTGANEQLRDGISFIARAGVLACEGLTRVPRIC